MSGIAVHGYAIVSADDAIADAQGRMPPSLMNDADWAYFQAELDRADFVLLGRASHAATPNARGRRRVVVSSSARALETRPDALWWNPADLGWDVLCAALLPDGGRIGVPGGQGVFDLCLPVFTAFHLSRAPDVRLPGGRGLFSEVERGTPAETLLEREGLRGGPTRVIDPQAGVTLRIFSRP